MIEEQARQLWNLGDGEAPIPIWLDCDTGHDDAFAILLAACCPRSHILGVSTVHGNASLVNTTKNTASILKAVGREDVRVYPGAAKPICREAVHAESIHGETGLDGTTLLPKTSIDTSNLKNLAINAMYEALIACPRGTAWLVTTGAMTNAALLFSVHPHLVDHIAGLSIMGGVVGGFFTNAPLGKLTERVDISPQIHKVFPSGVGDRSTTSIPQFVDNLRGQGMLRTPQGMSDKHVHALLNEELRSFGNWTPFAEFNIYIDPEAAQAVFGLPALAAKTTLIPLDVTHKVLANDQVLHQLGMITTDTCKPSTMRKLFLEIVSFFASTYASEFGMTSGPPLHDPLAVAAVLAPTLFDDNEGERFHVYVVREGDDSIHDHTRNAHNVGQCGRIMLTPVEAGQGGVRVPRDVGVEAFWELVRLSLNNAEARSGMDGEQF